MATGDTLSQRRGQSKNNIPPTSLPPSYCTVYKKGFGGESRFEESQGPVYLKYTVYLTSSHPPFHQRPL
jgi:hypothetical protein